MEAALRALIVAASDVTTLVSTRVYWGDVPQSAAKPWVRMNVISGIRDYHMEAPSGLVNSRVQVDCVAISYGAAKGIARAIETAISGYRGTQGSIKFGGVFIESERDDTESDTGDTVTLYRTSLDLIIWHGKA
jgi:hypothetical protein